MGNQHSPLRIEHSINKSGVLLNKRYIEILKESNYYVQDRLLDGDAPKQFIKAYFFTPDSCVRRSRPNSWPAFIAKTAEKWYPHESVIEFMINRIGEMLGLAMNEIKLAQINTQIRFLSKYFLTEGERLVHGAEICGEHLGDMEMADEIAKNKESARELFTFEFIKAAISAVYPETCQEILKGLVKLIAYDALVGNNDRHFYNWGVVDNTRKSKKMPKFAPIYDSARGLFWNYSDQNLKKVHSNYLLKGKNVQKYIDGACPRISIEDDKKANHFTLISFIKNLDSGYKTIIEELSSEENEMKVDAMLKKEFFRFFIKERCDLVKIVLQQRFERVRNA